MRISGKIFTALLLIVATTSCKDSNDGPTISIFQNIVTFIGNGNKVVNFEYQELDDSPVVRLSVPGELSDNEVKPGTRLLMTYTLPADVEYGEDCSDITLRGLQKIYNGSVMVLPYSSARNCNEPINLLTIYRTGTYINFTTLMPAVDDREYTLVAAEESLVDGNDAHLYLTTTHHPEAVTYNTRQVGSIDISRVWNVAGLRTVTVHVNNSQNPNLCEFTFEKK